MTTILRRASQLLTLRLLVVQLGLGVLLFLLFTFWLRIPDAGIFDLLLTLFVGLLLAAIAFGGEAFLLHRLRPLSHTRRRILLGALALFLAALLWFAWTALIDHLRINDSLRAGYLNSRFPAGSRNLFSYVHLLQALDWLWTLLQWLGTGILLGLALSVALARRGLRASPRLLLSLTYWVVFAIAVVAGTRLTSTLVQWTPGHSLPFETLSLLLRLGAAILFDLTVCSFILTTAAAILELREPLASPTYSGTPEPDASQPRTATNP